MAKPSNVVLVCTHGHLSATGGRTLGVCGHPEGTYLKGGLKAWKEAGLCFMETTRRDGERRLHEGGNPDGPGPVGRLFGRLTPPVFFAAGAAAAVDRVVLLICR